MIVILFILLIAIGTPIAVAIGLTTVVALYLDNIHIAVAARQMFSGIDSFTLIAIPFFIFAGSLMLEGGSSRRLVEMVNKWIGWTTGGLPIAGVLSSMFFSALSGSSPATVAAIGGVMIPSLKEARFTPRFSTGIICAAGSLGIIIPPSITMLVYGIVAEQSISQLFLAAVIPGIFIGILLILTGYVVAKRQGHKPQKKSSWKEVFRATREALWAIMMPVIVLGGIYMGVFTPTEAAAVAIVYSLFVSMFIYREIDIMKLFRVAKHSVVISSIVMFVISAAKIFSWYLTYQQIPDMVAHNILEFATSPFLILISINILLIIVGMFMDPSAAVIILVPLFLPVIVEFGISPIHFGVVMIVNLGIGMLTPPFGLNLFVASGVSKMSIIEVTRGVLPFIGVMLIALIIITFVPGLSVWLPEIIYGR